MYMKQSALYHYAIFGCLSYFYKASLKLDSNTLKSLKKRFTFFHTHKHLLCTNNTEWTGDTMMSKNWSLLLRISLSRGRKPDSSTDTQNKVIKLVQLIEGVGVRYRKGKTSKAVVKNYITLS